MAGFDVTAEARQGYAAPAGDNPHYWSSPAWLAWEAGAFLARQGRAEPESAHNSRGYSVTMVAGRQRFTFSASGGELDRFTLTPGARLPSWAVSYYVEAERYWQVAGEGTRAWANERRDYLEAATPGLKVRVRKV